MITTPCTSRANPSTQDLVKAMARPLREVLSTRTRPSSAAWTWASTVVIVCLSPCHPPAVILKAWWTVGPQHLLAQKRLSRASVVEIDQSARPYFRYGNGKWGQALYQVTLRSDVSGTPKQFKVYARPNHQSYINLVLTDLCWFPSWLEWIIWDLAGLV